MLPLPDGKLRRGKTRGSVVPEPELLPIKLEVSRQKLKYVHARISAVQECAKRLLGARYTIRFSETWVRQHFSEIVHPPKDALQAETKLSRQASISGYIEQLKQCYEPGVLCAGE